MSGDIQIKQFAAADQDALLSFLRIAYPDDPRKSEPSYWKWHFPDNPHAKPGDVPLWVVRRGEEIVGELATIPVELKVGEESAPAIWIIDLIVHEDLRGRGIGKRLFLAAGESYSTMLALGINEGSTAVLRSLKWAALGGIHRYHKLLYPGEALKEIRHIGPVREIVNLSYAPFRPRAARLTSEGSGTLRQITSFDASFDSFWQQASPQWPCAVERNSRYLEWQFMRQPGKKFDVLGLYEHDHLLGYVVLFFRKAERGEIPTKAAITDLCYDASASVDVVDELLKAALRLAIERRAGSLVTDVLDRRVEERLQRFGFWRIKASPQFMASTTIARYQDLLYQPSNWFLTRADSDVSIFEQPNL